MKKLLALVLALVMTLGLATVSASATTFSDDADIDHQEAVEVMNSLNIINGMGDGKFDPNGNVTRAQMAKMVTIALLGDVEVSAFTGTATDLKDVTGHWAEGYIKYCYSQGIISGRGNGIFDPNANVTTAEASKMLLVALGYNSDVRGYTGDQWAINVARDAQQKGMYKEIANLTSGKAMDRDDAAQLIYNTLNATRVIENQSVDTKTGAITLSYVDATNNNVGLGKTTLLGATFEAKTYIAKFAGNWNTGAANKKGYIYTTDGHDDTASSGTVDATFPSDLDISYIGEEIKVIYKDAKAGTANEPDDKDEIYGVYVTGNTTVINTTVAKIATGSDAPTDTDKVEIDGTEYTVAKSNNGTTIGNYNYNNSLAITAGSNGTSDAQKKQNTKQGIEALGAKRGDALKVIFDSDGNVAGAYVVVSYLGYISAVNSTNVSVANGTYAAQVAVGGVTLPVGSIKVADNDIYDGAAKNDIVVYTKLYNNDATNEKALTVVKKAEVVSGEVNGYKGNKNITVGGTKYTNYLESATATAMANLTDVQSPYADSDIGETFDLYLLNGYAALAKQTSEKASNYSLIIAKNAGTAGSTFNEQKIQVLGADGVKTTLIVNKDSTHKDGALAIGDIITWTGSADNAKITREADFSDSPSSGAKSKWYNKDTKTVNGVATTSDAVLFVCTTEDGTALDGSETFKAYAARSLNSFNTGANANWKTVVKDDKVVAAFVTLGSVPGSATAKTVYGIVTGSNGTVKIDDDYFTQYTLWTTDGEKTVNVASGGMALSTGNLYKFDPTADDQYVNKAGNQYIDAGFGITAAIKEYNEADGTLTYMVGRSGTTGSDGSMDWTTAATKTFTSAFASDYKVLYVNQDDDKAGSEIGINAYDAITNYYNAVVVLDDDQKISNLIIETSNKEDVREGTVIVGTATSSAAITAALAASDNVTVVGAATVDAGVAVAAGKTLTFTGALTAAADITGNGKLVINTVSDGATSTAHAKAKTVQVTSTMAIAAIEAIANKGTAGNTLILDEASTGNVATGTLFAKTAGASGTANATYYTTSEQAAAGTYVDTIVYTQTSSVGDTHTQHSWLKQA